MGNVVEFEKPKVGHLYYENSIEGMMQYMVDLDIELEGKDAVEAIRQVIAETFNNGAEIVDIAVMQRQAALLFALNILVEQVGNHEEGYFKMCATLEGSDEE